MNSKIQNVGYIKNNIYNESFIPYSSNCDVHANVNLDWIFEVVQEVAATHATILNSSIFDLQKIGLTWVISREKIDIYKYPKWREKVIVETWAQKPYRRVLVPRIIQAKNSDGELLFKATTLWAIIDLKTQRPIEPDKILDVFGFPKVTKDEKFYIHKRDIINDENHIISKRKPNINYSDTDFNHHVNNISYVRWALRSMPNDYRNDYKIKSVDVSWLKQTFLNDNVEIVTTSEDLNALQKNNATFYHKLVRQDNLGKNTSVFEAKSVWEKSN
ncbi:MAG: acyl-[acyl-carrier-protein] thioesterase [Pleomorphochaeta sp.]